MYPGSNTITCQKHPFALSAIKVNEVGDPHLVLLNND